MILDLTNTLALIDKYNALTGDTITFDLEYARWRTQLPELKYKIWRPQHAFIECDSLEACEHQIQKLIKAFKHQQQVKEKVA